MTMRRLGLFIAATCAVLIATACTRPSVVKGLYVLEPAAPAAVAKAQTGILRVGSVTVSAPYRSKQFVVRSSDLKYETDYYNEFLVAPSANIGEATARALSAANVFASVVPSTVTIDPDWTLDAFVDALYDDARNPDKPVAVLAITFFLRKETGDAAVPVWTRTYEKRVPFASASANGYVAALNTSLGDILAELARDLSSQKLAK